MSLESGDGDGNASKRMVIIEVSADEYRGMFAFISVLGRDKRFVPLDAVVAWITFGRVPRVFPAHRLPRFSSDRLSRAPPG
jgi:hypothetical protein